MSDNLVKRLKNLKYGNINPSSDWVVSNRGILLAQIKNTIPTPEFNYKKQIYFSFSGVSHIFKTVFSFKAVRPVMIVFIALFILPTFWVARSLAEGNSLPGDTLYSAKRALEKTQVALVSLVGDKNQEVQLHLELAHRRAYEVQKVVDDPSRKMKTNETVSSLKDELEVVNQKLNDFKNQSTSVSVGLMNTVQKQTGDIKTTLQEVKQTLQISTTSLDKDLTTQVALAKDLTKQVNLNTLDVVIASHLNGGSGVSKDDVNKMIDATLTNAIVEIDNSQQDVNGVKSVVDSVKTELNKEFASSSKMNYNIVSSSTKELTEKISNVVTQASQAASDTEAVSVDADKKVLEAKTLLQNGDLVGVVNKIKEVNEASKEAEKISENTLQKVQSVFPLVQIIRVKESDHSAVGINTSTMFVTTSTPSIVSTSSPSSSMVIILSSSTFKTISNTIKLVTPTTTVSSTSATTTIIVK